jgi:hypothetical protein
MKRIDNTYQKIANAMPIDFSELFNESIAVFKTVWLQGVSTAAYRVDSKCSIVDAKS